MAWLRRIFGRKAAVAAGQTAPDQIPGQMTGGHDAVRAADPYSFRVSHRRLAWLCRLSVMINVCLAFAVVSMAGAVSALMPLKEIRVALLKVAPGDDRVFEVQPLEQSTQGFDLVMEAAARRFVKNILEIDEATQTARFNEASSMAEADFWTGWLADHTDRITTALDDGLEREIIVETAYRMEQRPDEWLIAVDFQQIDRFGGEPAEEKALRAYLNMTVRPQQVRAADLFDNPLGVIVLDMTVKTRAGGPRKGAGQ